MNRTTSPAARGQLAALVLAAVGTLLLVSCAESEVTDSQTATVLVVASTSAAQGLSTPDATPPQATGDVPPAPTATPVAATAVIRRNTPTVVPTVVPTVTSIPTPTPASTEVPTSTPVPAPAPEPTLPPPPPRAIATGPVNRIAFGDGRGSIFTVNPDGTDLVAVAGGAVEGGDLLYKFPVWSPDGGSLAFSSIFVAGSAIAQTSYHRADADGTGDVITLAFATTAGTGVGPGIPHFSSWSPDGDRIALTLSGEFGIGTVVMGSYSGQSSRPIALGAPLYVNWAPDGTALLIHQPIGLHMLPVTDLGAGLPTLVGTGAMSYFSPSWAPDSTSFAHVEFVDEVNSVILTQKDDFADQVVITEADARVALGWSTDGNKLAIAKSDGIAFHTLSVFTPENGELRTLYEGVIRSFWWSPDSSKLAIVEDSPAVSFAHTWSVIDVESGDVTPLVTHFATDDFYFVQTFFDQFVESHSVWAPDSSQIVISGKILDPEEAVKSDGILEPPDLSEFQIWVIDAAGLDDPVSVGAGNIGSWSPR